MIDPKTHLETIKQTGAELKNEVAEKVVGYITGAFGLVAGLAWNDAIGELIKEVFPLGKNTVIAKFVYAVVITIIIVIVSMYLVKLFNKPKQD